MQESYSQRELDELLANVQPRVGWDFSVMSTLRQPVPWDYYDVVATYVQPSDEVLDIGTGGGEGLARLAGLFGRGLGIDIDPEMVRLAERTSAAANLEFRVGSARLEGVTTTFPLIINRHAELDLAAVAEHLRPGGYFITQQVGERNMACIRAALGQPAGGPSIRELIYGGTPGGLPPDMRLVAFAEYDVEYVVLDIESLVFWLGALDMLHADLDGAAALASPAALNNILAGNVDERGFVTNEHRYLVIAQATAS